MSVGKAVGRIIPDNRVLVFTELTLRLYNELLHPSTRHFEANSHVRIGIKPAQRIDRIGFVHSTKCLLFNATDGRNVFRRFVANHDHALKPPTSNL